MNEKIKKFLSNFSITLIANIVSMIVSSVVVFLVAACIGVKDYGYWQLYIFYCSYTSYFSFGLTDGVYLRNGGKKYSELDKKTIRPQYWVLLFLNIILTVGVIIFSLFQNGDINKNLVMIFACCSAVIIIPRSLLTMTMLSVNKIKENAYVLILEKIIYLTMIIIFLLLKIENFYFLIFGELFAQFISALFAIYLCKDLVFGKTFDSIKNILKESKINMSIGIKIVVAGLASMLIVGIVRMGIEQNWGIEQFAKVSLTLSVCNLLLVFIKAISVVIFPVLCNSSEELLKKIYMIARDSLGIVLLGLLIFYYPCKLILSCFLPQYSESLKYMAFLFPISLFESKTQLLLNTYFKALRKETLLLVINVITVVLSFSSSIIIISVFDSINLTIFLIVILLAFRCYLSEFLLLRIIGIKGKKDIFLEIIVSSLFVISSWFIGGYIGMILYLLIYIVFIFIKREQFLNLFYKLKGIFIIK